MRKNHLLLILLCIISILNLSYIGKNNFSIYGRLLDHGFNPITDFKIKILEEKKNILIRELDFKDANGEFIVKDLPVNKYILEITVDNYTKYTIKKEIVNKNESVGEIYLQNTW